MHDIRSVYLGKVSILCSTLKNLGSQEGEYNLSAFNYKEESGLSLKLESGISLTANFVVCIKKQTVPDTIETILYMNPE